MKGVLKLFYLYHSLINTRLSSIESQPKKVVVVVVAVVVVVVVVEAVVEVVVLVVAVFL